MIVVRDLRKTYRIGFFRRPVQALQGVSFEVHEGDLFGCIGPNGAGKSTAIKILLGLLFADAGEAELLGQPAGAAAGRRRVGYLPEQPYFYDYLTGSEFLRFYGGLSGLRGAALRARIETCRARTGVKEEWMDRKLRTYSKGMLQRMGLAQALLSEPRLLVLDEPMSGLDPLGRREVRALLNDLHREGVTIFYSSHVLSDVEAICTRLVMLVGGTERRLGTVDEVLAGETETSRIALEKPLDGKLPDPRWRLLDSRHVECPDQAAKTDFLNWALAQGLGVLTVERHRLSLEDVLAEEAGRKI
jgi:ABC-2 type transport system ATP-binding protein